MNQGLTDITLVIDRSGSMESIKSDAEGGINAFIQTQSKLPGTAQLTLIQFDTQFEFVHKGLLIDEVPPYKLEPRGATALLDAVGTGIFEAGVRLQSIPPDHRPGLVVFVIMTDGLENSSVEFTKEKIKEMIEHQEEKYSWQFIFLGANQDAFAEANKIGISRGKALPFSEKEMVGAFKCTGEVVAQMRGESKFKRRVNVEFTDEQRKEVE